MCNIDLLNQVLWDIHSLILFWHMVRGLQNSGQGCAMNRNHTEFGSAELGTHLVDELVDKVYVVTYIFLWSWLIHITVERIVGANLPTPYAAS